MVDPGEAVSVTLKREFGEEALNSMEASLEEKHEIEEAIRDLFEHGQEVRSIWNNSWNRKEMWVHHCNIRNIIKRPNYLGF